MTRELTIDNSIRDHLPKLSDEERAQLEANLIADGGALDPIITWANHEDTIIDGHNRYEICRQHGLSYTVKSLKFDGLAEVFSWIIDHQAGRRNLTPMQFKQLLAAEYSAKKKDVAENLPTEPKNSKNTEKLPKHQNDALAKTAGKTSAEIAKKHGTSQATVERAARTAEALEKVAPLARERLVASNANPSPAELDRLAELPPQQQRQAVDAVIAGEAKTIAGAVGKLAPPVAPSIVLDAIKRPIPKHLTEKHATAAQIMSAATKLDAAKQAVEKLAEQVGAEFLSVSEILEGIKAVKRKIMEARYWSECPRCQGKPQKKCERCNGHGYLPYARKGTLSADDKAFLGVE